MQKVTLILSLALLAASARAGDPNRWQDPKPDLPDLSVAYIERTPRYPGLEVKYRQIDWGPNGPKGDGLPARVTNAKAQHNPKPGQTVTFIAHVQNVGAKPSTRYDWHWVIDGKDVQGGWSEPLSVYVPQPANAPGERVYKLAWKWQPGRHYVAFEVDRNRLTDQVTHKNDFVVDATDALSFHFFVEKGLADWFATKKTGLDSYSWADWAQFQVREMNREFMGDIFPATPAGITIRARVDKITVLPNDYKDPGGTHAPVGNVTSGWDGVWGFTNGYLEKDAKTGKNVYERLPQWLTGNEWSLHHELGHQFGQPDYYLLPVTGANNHALPGVAYNPPDWFQHQMMFSGNYYHDEQIGQGKGTWDSGYRFWGQHAADAFNVTKDMRRGFFGTFLVDVPAKNSFLVVDEQLRPIPNAEVKLYQSVSRDYGNGFFNATPDFTGHTDARGVWTLDRSPFKVVLNWTSNGALQFVVTPPSAPRRVGFLNITDFNLAYWRGHTKSAEYTVKTAPVP